VNYRHAYHAGNFADVLKHALLVRLMRALQKKEKGFMYVDTHAGRGGYDLSQAAEGDTHARIPEWPDGIGRLWDRSDIPAEMAEYLEIVLDYNRYKGSDSGPPRFYPGSPRIAAKVCRPQDRMDLWEKHPEEFACLRDDFAGERRVAVHKADGYVAPRASLPPTERRALVLIDPPFEAPNEWDAIGAAVGEGLGRLPAATFAIWYPLTDRAHPDGFAKALEALKVPTFAAELIIEPGAPGMSGCGVVVANPPWKFEGEAGAIVSYVATALRRGQEAQGSVRWVVPE
jgi:23S rRNA (adenine2030-N6)-methyltransferase